MARLFRGIFDEDDNSTTDVGVVPSWAINGVFHHFPTLRLPAEEMEALNETREPEESEVKSKS